MTLKQLADKHGLPVTVVSEDPLFGGIFFTLENEDRDGRGFWFSRPNGHQMPERGYISYMELRDTWVTEAEWTSGCLVTP